MLFGYLFEFVVEYMLQFHFDLIEKTCFTVQKGTKYPLLCSLYNVDAAWNIRDRILGISIWSVFCGSGDVDGDHGCMIHLVSFALLLFPFYVPLR